MVIRVYWASVTGNRKVNGDQSRLRNLIESLKLESKWIDITTSRSVMDEMRKGCSDPKAMPPQIFNDDIYLGTVDDMNESIEAGCVKQWLRLESVDGNPVENAISYGESTNGFDETDHLSNVPDAPSYNPPSTELISSAVKKFENNNNNNKSPEVSRKTIELQMSNEDPTTKMDEERRRRILGLLPLQESDTNKTEAGVHGSQSNGVPTKQ